MSENMSESVRRFLTAHQHN